MTSVIPHKKDGKLYAEILFVCTMDILLQVQFYTGCLHTDGVFMGISHINYRWKGVKTLLYSPAILLKSTGSAELVTTQ